MNHAISDFRFPISDSLPRRLENSARKSEIGNRKSAILTGAMTLLLSVPLAAAEKPPRELVLDGNSALAKGDFQKALEAYRSAEVSLPETPELFYNQGIAHYRLGDYVKARELFNQALSTRDLAIEQRTKYNLGNVAYAESLQKLSDLQVAIDGLRQAINHYRDALALDPNDTDARANIETAQLLIKDLLDKQKQQQEQQQQNQDQEQENQQQDQQQEQRQEQQQQQKPESQPSSQPSQSQQQQQEQEQQQDQKQQQGQQEQQQEQQQGEQQTEAEQKPQPQQGEKRELSREEAQRLLQAIRDREKEHNDREAKRVRVRRVPVEKDW